MSGVVWEWKINTLRTVEESSAHFSSSSFWRHIHTSSYAPVCHGLEDQYEKQRTQSKHKVMNSTEFLISGLHIDQLHDFGFFPCTVCQNGVGANFCTMCHFWSHKSAVASEAVWQVSLTMSALDVIVRLTACQSPSRHRGYIFRCHVMASFCYLGDMFNWERVVIKICGLGQVKEVTTHPHIKICGNEDPWQSALCMCLVYHALRQHPALQLCHTFNDSTTTMW